MVALDAEVREPEPGARKRPFFEVFVVIVAALALVVGLYAFGNALADDNDDGVAATGAAAPTAAASAGATGAQAASAAADTSAHAHDETGTAVDDRGFSALANGEQHAHTFTQAVSPADRAELARQLTLARQVALQYPTVKDAEAAGLHRAGPFSPGLGAHYINYAGALGNTDGKMTDAAIRKPLAWIYDGTKPDSHIAGLFYMTSNADPVGFAGSNDTWHVHHDICIKPAANGTVDAPLGADHATKAQCSGRRQPREADAVPAARVGGARYRAPKVCSRPQLRSRATTAATRRSTSPRPGVDHDLRRRHGVTRRAPAYRRAHDGAAVSAGRVLREFTATVTKVEGCRARPDRVLSHRRRPAHDTSARGRVGD